MQAFKTQVKQKRILRRLNRTEVAHQLCGRLGYICALKTEALGMSEHTLNLHFGSALYTREQLNQGDHVLSAEYKFGDGYVKLSSANRQASTPIEGQDMFCEANYDKATKTTTYELKIRRGYLRDNGCPDNHLAYTLTLGTAEHYFRLPTEVKTLIEELGVEKKFIWTYNYAYFGTRPEASEVPAVTTEAPATEDPGTDDSGCSSALTLSAVAMLPVIAGVAFVAKRKED